MSRWRTLAVVSTALFMVTLDNLVVTTALPSIRADLNASLSQLEGVVNAYTLTFGVLMLLGASAGERFGRRGTFAAGLLLFTAASAACALAPSADALIVARAIQGVGGAVVLPLSLTLLADAFPDDSRGLALGIWSGISGIGVALGPLVGGLVVEAGSWQWVFWINVPVGVMAALACCALAPSVARRRRIDIRGAVLGTAGLAGVVVALGGTQHASWLSGRVLVPLVAGLVLLAGFLLWERVAPEPMLPLGLFAFPVFRAVNYVNVTMYFGMFGCIFLLAPFLQIVQGLSPLEAGVRILPWTLMPLVVSPIAGIYCDRVGARKLIGWGMALQATALAWIALILSPDLTFAQLLFPCLLGGVGMALVYPPTSAAMLASVDEADAGVASGAVNSLRELAGAVGIAVLAWVFTTSGGATGASSYVSGLAPALLVGSGVLASGLLAVRRLPGAVRPVHLEPLGATQVSR
jgi:EmrB/QacA subfamily drug resistance transporter